MDSVLFFALVVSAFTGALSTSSTIDAEAHALMTEEGQTLIYSRYSACRRGREFAIVVGQTERVNGRVYYERVKTDGKVKFYFCASCTVCADYGLAAASPCTERANAECSAYCLVPGCAFDEASASCRHALTPGSWQSGDVTEDGDHTNSCGMSMTSQVAASDGERPLESEKKKPSSLLQGNDATTVRNAGAATLPNDLHYGNYGSTLQALRRSEKPSSKQENTSSWVASEALFVGTGIVTAVIIANIAAVLYIRSKKRQSRKRPTTNSTEVLYAALARARSDSNVTKTSHSSSVTAV